MNWLFFALLAPAIYAIVVFIDKYILEKKVKDYLGMPIYSSIVAGVFGIIIWIVTGFPLLSPRDTILIILTGVLTVFGLTSYFKALSDDEASKVTILFQMTPVITLVLSYLFLGDKLSVQQFLGFILILISTIGISVNKSLREFNFSNTFFLILLTDFLWASAFVLFKFVVDTNSFVKLISYESFGIGIGGLILYTFFPSIKMAFKKTNKQAGSVIFWFIIVNETIFLISRLLTYLAISKGPVALVDVVAGTQVIFAIVYGFILTKISPKTFQEDISQGGLSKKIIIAALILLGLVLIQM
ncbi:MAG: EamA family transporter [Candidatus Daviesbacteria bacterium]|nr:EamA family transporter [Candidatus Daviesbacteria bacterium]